MLIHIRATLVLLVDRSWEDNIAKMANPADEGIDINTDGNVISDYVHPHAVNAGIPVEEIRPPTVGNEFEVDEMVREGKI